MRIGDSRVIGEQSGELGRKSSGDLEARREEIERAREVVAQQRLQNAFDRRQRQATRYTELADSGAAGAPRKAMPSPGDGEAAPRRPSITPITPPGTNENSVRSLIGHNAAAPPARSPPAANPASGSTADRLGLVWPGGSGGGGATSKPLVVAVATAPKRRSDAGPNPGPSPVGWGGQPNAAPASGSPPKRARGAALNLLAWDAEPVGGLLTQSPCAPLQPGAAASPLPSPLPSPGGSMASRIAQRRREVAQGRERERERQSSDRASPRSQMARMEPAAPEDRLAARMARMARVPQVNPPVPFRASVEMVAGRRGYPRQEEPPPYERAPPIPALALPPRPQIGSPRGARPAQRPAPHSAKAEHTYGHDRGVLAVMN